MPHFTDDPSRHPAIPDDEGPPIRAVVKWFSLAKGFGFVSPLDGEPDAFLHVSVVNRAGLSEIVDGTAIVCRVAPGAKGPQVSRIVEVTSAPEIEQPPAAGPEVEMFGTVKWFKPEKGFGFVTADDASKDVFVHKSVLRRCGLVALDTGQRVQMRVQEAPKGREATWIVPVR